MCQNILFSDFFFLSHEMYDNRKSITSSDVLEVYPSTDKVQPVQSYESSGGESNGNHLGGEFVSERIRKIQKKKEEVTTLFGNSLKGEIGNQKLCSVINFFFCLFWIF